MSAPEKFTVTAFFGDAEHKFSLHNGKGYDLVRELEDKRACGPMALFRRLYSGNYGTDDIGEILRIGLVGGGMTPPDAAKLVKRYVDTEPLNEHAGTALEVLGAVLFGKGNVETAAEAA